MNRFDVEHHTSLGRRAASCVCALLVALVLADSANATVYYVDESHSQARNVDTVAPLPPGSWGVHKDRPFKTIDYAASRVATGDIIYVKAGEYGPSNDSEPNVNGFLDGDGITFTTSGVSIIGYETTIGDLDAGQGVPNSYTSLTITNVGTINDDTAPVKPMPELVGSSYSGTGFDVWGANVVLKNFVIKKFNAGVIANNAGNFPINGENALIQNLVTKSTGDPLLDGTGIGIWVRLVDEVCTIRDCLVYNSAECAYRIVLAGDSSNANIIVDGCQAYCDDDSTPNSGNSGTDYYFDIDSSSNVTVTDCHAERIGGLYHGGKAFAIQAKNENIAKNNKFINCHAYNIDEAWVHSRFAVMFNVCFQRLI